MTTLPRSRGGNGTVAAVASDIMVDRRWAYGWIWASFWLIYLVHPLVVAWHLTDPTDRAVGVGALLLFGAVYVSTFAAVRTLRRSERQISTPVRLAVFGTIAALAAVIIAIVGEDSQGLLVYLAVMAMFLYPGRPAWLIIALLLVTSFALPRLIGAKLDGSLAFQILVASVAMWGVMLLVQRNAQLAAAREEITRLAVADERSRFARDLHDILGHTLTVVTVKAELAGRLVRAQPEQAETEIADIERLSRQALTDVRAAVSGFREVTLAGELAGARTALAAADIRAELPLSTASVPAGRSELFGWVVREGVTNVVRHSGASVCRIRVTPREIEISDDGKGPNGQLGHGLTGLSERAAAAGASLSVGRSHDGGYSLRLRLP